MKYEIPREAFKQRLEDRLNFVLVDLQPEAKTPAKYENVVHIEYGPQFKNAFTTQVGDKNKNIILYSLVKGDESPARAADELAELGYNFVYYYKGTPDDVVLDKGLN
jgi:rhodanese-related sulfurtransferase